MIKDIINAAKSSNKKYPFNNLVINNLNEDYIDDFDNDEEDAAHGLDDLINNSAKYYSFMSSLKDIADKLLSEIDQFPIKLYKSTSVLANKSATALTYDDVIKDLSSAKGSDSMQFNQLTARNFSNRQQQKEDAMNVLSSADCINFGSIGFFDRPTNNINFPKYAKRDTVIDFAERLVMFKHSLDGATDYVLEKNRTDEECIACVYCAFAVLTTIITQFKAYTLKTYDNYIKMHPNNTSDYLNRSSSFMTNSSTIAGMLAIILEYLNHNCRQIPDSHISPLNIPDSIAIADKPNSRNSNISLKRFAYNSLFFENCVTSFDDKQLQYEFSKTNDRVKNVIFNMCSTTEDNDPSKADFSKIRDISQGPITYEKISNLDFHKNISLDSDKKSDSDSDYEKFNISTSNIKNWFLRLFNMYTFSPNSSASGSSAIEQIFAAGALTNTTVIPVFFGILNSKLIDSKYGTLQGHHVWLNPQSEERNKMFPVKNIYEKYFSEFITDVPGGVWQGVPTDSATVGSTRFFESIVFDELKKTTSKQATIALALSKYISILKSKKTFNSKEVYNFIDGRQNVQKIANQDFYLNIQMLKQISKTKKASSLLGYQNALAADCSSNTSPVAKSCFDYISIIRPDLSYNTDQAVLHSEKTLTDITVKEINDRLSYVDNNPKIMKPFLKYGIPILGTKAEAFASRLKYSLQDLFAESFDELVKAASQYTFYDSENNIYDYEYIDILKKRRDFAEQLKSQYTNDIANIFSKIQIKLEPISKYVYDFKMSTEELVKMIIDRGIHELDGVTLPYGY